MTDKKNKTQGRNYLASAFVSVFIICIVKLFWPGLIPVETWSFWKRTGGFGEWIKIAWPIFVWGVAVNVVVCFRSHDKLLDAREDGINLWLKGILVSLWAGFVEEVAFRWLIFLAAMATIRLPNFLFFGFAGLGIPEWFHNHLLGPIANWTTFGALESHIFSEHGWAVGAAMLATNAFFRDGHKYQGLFGWVNAWFTGLFFFWMMFAHGLWAAIVVHFLYDFLIFTYIAFHLAAVNAVDRHRRHRGY